MIDRSYLPFQSAREYQDPGIQKWMGFFLSEHTSSLDEERNRVDISPGLSKDKKLLFLSQLYIGQLKGRFPKKTLSRQSLLTHDRKRSLAYNEDEQYKSVVSNRAFPSLYKKLDEQES